MAHARAGSKLLLANRMARLFVVAYLVLLHLFVVAMLYIWSASGGSSAEIDVAALAPLMAPSAQARVLWALASHAQCVTPSTLPRQHRRLHSEDTRIARMHQSHNGCMLGVCR